MATSSPDKIKAKMDAPGHSVPAFFGCRRHLERSVLDVVTFSIPRKLPLITDIVDRATAAPNADYIIYSNVDIAVVLHLSLWIASLAKGGTHL